MPHDVFVSYSSDDKPTADAVCATLENKGIRCWIAPRDILPGMEWGGAIVDAINASRLMVLVYSAKANDSPQIKREVERAVNHGLAIIPFRIEDVPMSTTLEYFMSMPHWLDALTPPLQDHLDRLATTTSLLLERAGVDPRDVSDWASDRPAGIVPAVDDIAQHRPAYWALGDRWHGVCHAGRGIRTARRQDCDDGPHRRQCHRHRDPCPGTNRPHLAPAAGRAADRSHPG